jgi:hypothetical protein
MTEMKITMYSDRPVPEWFKKIIEEQLKRAVQQGSINGYEMQVRDLANPDKTATKALKAGDKIKKEYMEELKNAEKTAEDALNRRIKATPPGASELDVEGGVGGTGGESESSGDD